MFPLPILTWIKLGSAVAVCGLMWFMGYSYEASRFERYKTEQAAQTAKIEKDQQSKADQIAKEKNAQIATINSQLADALVQLRSRPSRTDQTSNGQNRTGLSLSAEDGAFLEREAARADGLRTALDACYKQYDSLK